MAGFDSQVDKLVGCSEGLVTVLNGDIEVKKLTCRTGFEGIRGSWAVKKKFDDAHHSFLVLSFLEETRVLSVGEIFEDVSEEVGFEPKVSTLACGLVKDSVLVQVDQQLVRVIPVDDIPHATRRSWSPDDGGKIDLGAVGPDLVIISTAFPFQLFILKVDFGLIHLLHRMTCDDALSCIFLPKKTNTFVIGTHKPSVEILNFSSDRAPQRTVVGSTSTGKVGTSTKDFVPQDVRLVCDGKRLYVLAGLRNGMLCRFECPVADSTLLDRTLSLRLDDFRGIGVGPVSLIPLEEDSMTSNIIALGDMPWLVEIAMPSLFYTPLHFPPCTHLTPVSSNQLPHGAIAVSGNEIHLVEIPHSKFKETYRTFSVDPFEPSVRDFMVGCNPRKVVLFQMGLLVVLRSDDICCMDSNGSVLRVFALGNVEIGRCMEVVEVQEKKLLVVGTGFCKSKGGRMLVLRLEQNHEDGEAWCCKLEYSVTLDDEVLAVCPLFDNGYFVVSLGKTFNICKFKDGNSHIVDYLNIGIEDSTIEKITAHSSTFAILDHKNNINVYSSQEGSLKGVKSNVTKGVDCIIIDMDTIAVLDHSGIVNIFSHLSQRRGDLVTSFFIDEKAVRILKGSFSKHSLDDPTRVNFIASTKDGRLIDIISLTQEEYKILKIVQDVLEKCVLIAPILGKTHANCSSHGSVSSSPKPLDGDMLAQLLQLSVVKQEEILARLPENTTGISVDTVKQLLQWVSSGGPRVLER